MRVEQTLVLPSVWRRLGGSRGFELALYVVGGLGPAVLLWILQGRSFAAETFTMTIVALAIGLVLVWHALAKLRSYARSHYLSYVMPVNFGILSGVLGTIALLRAPYSVSLFSVGATAVFVTSFAYAVYSRRLQIPHFVVLAGRASEIKCEGQYLPAPAPFEIEELLIRNRDRWALVADLHYCHPPQWERLFARAALAGVPVYHFRQVAEMQTGQVKISHLSENDLGSLIPNVPYMSPKRWIDLVAALLLLPFCLVAFVVIGSLIRLDSPGKVFFIQERVGFRGQRFRMIKFRTMRDRPQSEGSEDCRNDAITKSADERITKIGRILRKTRMDELPQIFNVLRGEMSLIGPRPEALALSQWYDSELPFYSYRHIVRPGITGWAQVNQGHVTDVNDTLAKLRFDFYYIKNISLWLDLLIALKTIRVIVTGNGAK